MARYRFNKYHIDKTWQNKFSEEGLRYLENERPWLWDKILMATKDSNTNEIGIDFIIIIDMGEYESNTRVDGGIRSVVLANDNNDWNRVNYMLFSGDLYMGAVQNMQSENETIKEIANAIVRGANVAYDPDILFPYTIASWKTR